MKSLKDQLAGIAALVAAIVAIGGGFIKYGEITTKLAEAEENINALTTYFEDDGYAKEEPKKKRVLNG